MPEIKEGDTAYDPNLTTQGQSVPETDEGKELCTDTPDGQSAHTLERPEDTKKAVPIEVAPPMEVHRGVMQEHALREDLVRSVVMSEILEKPLALRKGGRRL